jgi:hypothetical protein
MVWKTHGQQRDMVRVLNKVYCWDVVKLLASRLAVWHLTLNQK